MLRQQLSIGGCIRAKHDAGVLPRLRPPQLRSGFGSGMTCDGCEEPDQSRVFRMYLGCVGLWEALRRKRGLARAVSSASSTPVPPQALASGGQA
jgi:hypothetical protein